MRKANSLIWDGASIHRSLVIKDFLKKGGSKRIQIERLPAYAPELNPQEGVWNLLKRVQLKNVCCQNLQDLRQKLLHAKERLSIESSHFSSVMHMRAIDFRCLCADQ